MRALKIVVYAAIAAALAPAHVFAAAPGGEKSAIEAGGRKRTYLVHLPPAYSPEKRWPVVFALHGPTQDGRDAAKISRFDNFADRNGIVAVYPDGYKHNWADGRGTTAADRDGVDDVGFLTALLDRLEKDYSVDGTRVYVAGASTGGFMALRLACDQAGRFAAVASVAATLSLRLSQNCHPARPVPVIEINGTADPFVPYKGGEKKGPDGGLVLSAEDSAKTWAQLDGCGEPPARDSAPPKAARGMETQRADYAGCRRGAEVVLYTIVGGGHTWPGGEQFLPVLFIGRTSRDFDADEAIWKFFSAHPLAADASSGKAMPGSPRER